MSKVSVILSILLAAISTICVITYHQYSTVKTELSETRKKTVSVSDFQRLSDQLSRVTAERSDAAGAIAHLKGELKPLKKYPKKLASLEKQFTDLQETLKKKDTSLNEKEQAISKLKKDHEKTVFTLSDEIRKLKGEAAEAQTAIADQNQKIADLKQETLRKNSSLNEKEQAISKLKKDHGKTVFTLSDEIRKLKGEASEAQSTIADCTRKIAGLKQKVLALQVEQKKLSASKKHLALLQKEQENKEKSTQKLKATYDNLLRKLKKEIEAKEITVSRFEEKLKISLVNQILFTGGSCEITPEGKKVLKQVAQILKTIKDKHIFVVGHTDNLPIGENLFDSFPTNWELSAARAAAVVRFLTEKGGIEPEIFATVGRSFHDPAQTNETPEGRAQNRRAEIIVTDSLGLESGKKTF